MARPPRFILPGHPQHVIIRGNIRNPIFNAGEGYHFHLDKSDKSSSTLLIPPLLFLLLILLWVSPSHACDEDSVSLFSCQAADGRKFIELCSSSPLRAGGFLQYRFGALDKEGREKAVELVYPTNRAGSLKRFFGATYTYKGTYTQSVRFSTGQYSYTVYTNANGARDEGAGVEVRNLSTGKLVEVTCSERPRFYIFELTGLIDCDAETPVGKACIK
jgi:hypothetical protein